MNKLGKLDFNINRFIIIKDSTIRTFAKDKRGEAF
jgi:hypothetical protein